VPRQPVQFSLPKVYQALPLLPLLPLLLLSLLLLAAQLPGLMTTHASTSISVMSDHVPHCMEMDADCDAPQPPACCAETLSDCVLECAQGAAWINTVPVAMTLAVVRALPPPIEQRWSEQPPEQPYQPPRLTLFV